MPQPDDRAQAQEQAQPRSREADRAAAAAKIQHQSTWVDLQIRQAQERGAFDNLAGAGKPIEGLGSQHDPDWWLKKLVERERIVVLPPSIMLRKEDAELDDRLDKINVERDVRREVEDFNERVLKARYSLSAGPPLITMPRDVDATVDAWRARRAVRRVPRDAPAAPPPKRHWWNRRTSGEGDT
jgi:hypothetical protein